MIKIKTTILEVGYNEPKEVVRRRLEETVQREANEGWTLRTATSRGGSFYLVFARKEKG